MKIPDALVGSNRGVAIRGDSTFDESGNKTHGFATTFSRTCLSRYKGAADLHSPVNSNLPDSPPSIRARRISRSRKHGERRMKIFARKMRTKYVTRAIFKRSTVRRTFPELENRKYNNIENTVSTTVFRLVA